MENNEAKPKLNKGEGKGVVIERNPEPIPTEDKHNAGYDVSKEMFVDAEIVSEEKAKEVAEDILTEEEHKKEQEAEDNKDNYITEAANEGPNV